MTAREVEVLRLVAQGLTDAQLAEHLVISLRTVTTHLTSIYNKLGVNSHTAAARFVIEHQQGVRHRVVAADVEWDEHSPSRE